MGLPDEISAYADAALARAEIDGIYVPDLWLHELANGLAIAHIRQRLTVDQEQQFLAAPGRLDITIQLSDGINVIRSGAAAARQYGLTAYDAAYVNLAVREKLEIATLDARMRDAAVKAGVAIFDTQQ